MSKPGLSERIGGWIDRVVAMVSPERGVRRQAHRQAFAVQAQWYHRGASFDRSKRNWKIGNVPADTANLAELPTLRGRVADLLRNTALASGLADTFVVNEVGTGIRPQSRIDYEAIGISSETAGELQKVIERAWRKWSKSVTVDGKLGAYQLQELTSRTEWATGECFLIRRYRKRRWRPYSFCVQIVEPERICTPMQYDQTLTEGREIRDGIEIDQWGEPVAYWVANSSPLDGRYVKAREFQRIPAFGPDGRPNVIHHFHMKRTEQTHGVPALGPVVEIFDHLTGYLESEWVRARVAACFAAFVKRAEGTAYGAAIGNATTDTAAAAEREEKLLPGTIQYLNAGEEVQFANPNLPGNSFDAFVLKAIQFIGASLGLPLELVLKDFSRTNYSSARAALLEARRMFLCRRARLVDNVLQPMWELFVDELVLRGELALRDYEKFRAEYTRSAWIAPGWEWVDPVKEADATVTRLSNGLTTMADELADQGRDWEEQLAQIAREKAKCEEMGLPWPGEKEASTTEPQRAQRTVDEEENQDPSTDGTDEGEGTNGTDGSSGTDGTNGGEDE